VRIGLLGGTFDPVHVGHLRLARTAERALHLDRMYFVPARQPWHKARHVSPWVDRYAMLALALAGRPRWMPLNIPPAGGEDAPTYSVNEVGWLQQRRPGDEIFFLIGADAFHELPTWKDYRRLLGMCDFILVPRAGQTLQNLARALPDDMIRSVGPDRIELTTGRTVYWLPRFRSRISSTGVRQELAAGKRTRQVPAAVSEYACRGGLYGARPERPGVTAPPAATTAE
jgi:nicotinate-nucleotide adenylyltransferase